MESMTVTCIDDLAGLADDILYTVAETGETLYAPDIRYGYDAQKLTLEWYPADEN